MRVFVTGASGYVGSVVAEYLSKAGHAVSGLVRKKPSAETLPGIELLEGDLSDVDLLRRAARAADAVVHAAMSWGPEGPGLDERAVRTIIGALEGSKKPFVYTSGTWVMGDTRGRVAAELAVARPPELVKWRLPVEKLVLQSVDQKVNGIVVRPAMVYGRGGGTVGDFARQARANGVVRMVGSGENHWCFVPLEALAELYVRCVERLPGGELFLAADGPAFTLRTVVETVATMHEARVEVIPLEEARKTMGPLADALVMDQKIMTTKAGRLLGWGPKLPSVLDDIRNGSYT